MSRPGTSRSRGRRRRGSVARRVGVPMACVAVLLCVVAGLSLVAAPGGGAPELGRAVAVVTPVVYVDASDDSEGGTEDDTAGRAKDDADDPRSSDEAGRAAAAAGYRAPADTTRAWAGNPVATPMLIANGPMRDRPVSLRFRALADGCVTELRPWWRYNPPDEPDGSYSGGDGGRYRVELRPDDGTGVPADEVLDAGEFVADILTFPYSDYANQSRPVAFGGEACLVSGQTYHFVLDNVHEDPRANFVSFNGPYLSGTSQDVGEANACPSCLDHAVLRLEVDGRWILYPEDHTPDMVYAPHWCAVLDGGAVVGQSLKYGHRAVRPAPLVGGDRRVRQRLEPVPGSTPPSGPLRLAFYARRSATGEGPLRVSLDGAPGVVVDVASLTPEAVAAATDPEERADGERFDWYELELDAARVPGEPVTVEFLADGADAEFEIGAGVRSVNSCGGPVVGGSGGNAEFSVDGGVTWNRPGVFDRPDRSEVQLSLVLVSTEDH